MRIDYEDAVLLLKQIVADRGEGWIYPQFDGCRECYSLTSDYGDEVHYCDWHTNEGCRYFTEQGAPACIVGEFFSRTLQPEDYNRFHLEGRIATEALNYLPLEVDDRTRRLLSVAQQRQDEGMPWGESLTRAIDTANTFTE